jgi:hypothetical protein
MDQNNLSPHTWWGQIQLDIGQTGHWKIDPLNLAIQHLANEWQIAYQCDEAFDPTTDEWSQEIMDTTIDELNYATVERYVVEQTDGNLYVMPALADRPVVTRPLRPLFVLPGDQITIFVSSPLWVSIAVGDSAEKLQEVPIHRPSDTWFGPSTMEGELCYASRTCGNLNLENVPVRSHRAITEVTIRNQADTQLHIEHLNLPVPYLSLFEAGNGTLWTEAVTMVRAHDAGMAEFQIEKSPSDVAVDAQRIFDPRQQPVHNMVIRAFGVLFG